MSRKDLEVYETKSQVFERDGWKCHYCGKPAPLQLAHRIPQTKRNLKKYGPEVIHHPLNLITTCDECNDKALVGQNWAEEQSIVEEIQDLLITESYAGLPL